MVKYLRNSSYVRTPFHIHDFATFFISAQRAVLFFCACSLFPEALRQESDHFHRCSRKKNETIPKSSNRPLFQEIVGCDGKVKKLKPGECEDICVDQTTYTNEYQVYRNKQKKWRKLLISRSFFHPFCKTLKKGTRQQCPGGC
jgi:hypothetical protein